MAAVQRRGIQEDAKQDEPSTPLRKQNPPSSSSPSTSSSTSPFVFWCYFTVSVALITFLFASIYPFIFSSDDGHRSWFLDLPDDLRRHYSSGRTIKVEIGAGRSPAEVFAVEAGPREGSETLVLIHGFGGSSFSFRHLLPALASKGLRAVAVDLPGSGFSDKFVTVEEEEENPGGILGVYYDIKEKGLFWGFDKLIETGQIPYNGEETRANVRKRKVRKPIDSDAAELGRVIRQVVESMRLAPVHLVLHDTGVGPGAMWAAAEESDGTVRSVTMVDGAVGPALPMWAVEMPAVREVALGMPIVYFGLMRWCCSRSIERAAAEAHRVLLKGKGGLRAVVEVGRRSLNTSFHLGEWAQQEKVRDLPVQLLWSQSWSPEWIEEGRRVAMAIPRAKFVGHSGGRWPQEDAADELGERIAEFVKSLPKSIKLSEEEPVPEHIQKMLEEANSGDNHHHHHQHHHDHHQPGLGDQWGHDHAHAAGYMDAYGLGHGLGG